MRKNKETFIICALTSLIIMLTIVGGCTYLNEKAGLKQDHYGEELLEELIQAKTGLDIDLSPESPE